MRAADQPGLDAFVANLTWDEVERRLAGGVTAILPVGAAAKEHGLHLPMNTDEIQANWWVGSMAEFGDALVWPALTYGFYPAFREFPGSVTLTMQTFMALAIEVIGEILRWKPKRLFVLDTGISTIRPLGAAISAVAWERPVIHLKIYEGRAYLAAVESLRQQTHGSHADELETSKMLAIAPEKVDMARATGHGGGALSGPLTRETAASGSYGSPEFATKAKGDVLVKAMLDDLRQAFLAGEEKEN